MYENIWKEIKLEHRNIKIQGITTAYLYCTGHIEVITLFPLDIDVNDILNYRTNNLLRKCRTKAIGNKLDCLGTRLLIVTFYEIAIKYESELKTQLVLLDISTSHNVGSPRSLHFKFCHMIYLFKTFIRLWRIFINAVGYLIMTFQRSWPNYLYLSSIT